MGVFRGVLQLHKSPISCDSTGPNRVVSGVYERMPPSRTHRLPGPAEPTPRYDKISYSDGRREPEAGNVMCESRAKAIAEKINPHLVVVLSMGMRLTVSPRADQLRSHKDQIGSFPMRTRGYPLPHAPPTRSRENHLTAVQHPLQALTRRATREDG